SIAGGARRLPRGPAACHAWGGAHGGEIDDAKGGAMTNGSIALGVNIDHVATLRQARRSRFPDPVHAALAAESAGADSITLHLREDRRHIQDRDVRALRGLLQTRMNLELAVTDEMLRIAAELRPEDGCRAPGAPPSSSGCTPRRASARDSASRCTPATASTTTTCSQSRRCARSSSSTSGTP